MHTYGLLLFCILYQNQFNIYSWAFQTISQFALTALYALIQPTDSLSFLFVYNHLSTNLYGRVILQPKAALLPGTRESRLDCTPNDNLSLTKETFQLQCNLKQTESWYFFSYIFTISHVSEVVLRTEDWA